MLKRRIETLEAKRPPAEGCPWRIHRAITQLGYTVPTPDPREPVASWLRRVPSGALSALVAVR